MSMTKMQCPFLCVILLNKYGAIINVLQHVRYRVLILCHFSKYQRIIEYLSTSLSIVYIE